MTLVVQYYGNGKPEQVIFKGEGSLEAFATFLKVIGPTNLMHVEANS